MPNIELDGIRLNYRLEGDGEHTVSGHIVLTDERVAPNRPPPLVIRDVLVQECQSVRDQARG